MRRTLSAALLLVAAAACPSTKTTAPPPESPGQPTDTPMNPPVTQPDKPVEPTQPQDSPADALTGYCRQNLASAKDLLGRVLAVREARTADNTLVPYNHLMVHVNNAVSKAGLFSNVHPDETVRTAAQTCEQEVVAFSTDLSLNRELFEAFKTLDISKADADTRRLVERTLRDFRRAGVDKDEAARKRLKELADLQVKLGQEFDKNIRDDVRTVKLDPAQLDGLPDDYRKAHPPGDDGKVTITTDYPDFFPLRTYARDAGARLALFREFNARGYPGNDRVLKDLIRARREQATLLGYKSWADYITEDKMIGSAKNVQDFIAKIAKAADKRARKDYALLLKRKQQDDPKARSLDQSESMYYEELVKRESFAFDSQEVRPYFEFNQTRDGLLTITAKLFGVEYKAAADTDKWHPDVDVYDVYKGGHKQGRIYLDLHPRAGKYKHAAQFGVVSGVAGEQLPEGALVCNFPDPKSSDGPALMEHDDVTTMFHEFGHLMHHILGGHQKWVYFSGVATEWDFVEAPSQMLEEWAWDPSTLALFARHVETKQPIPAELVKRMRAANELGKGTFARHQMFYASMSLGYHTTLDIDKLDMTKAMAGWQNKYSMYRYVDGTHMYASFGHLNGYSAMYYTYMWSLVIAKDLFSAFEKNGLLDPATAQKYRDSVLVPGGSQDAAVLVRNFLGREYSFASFQQWLDRN